MIDAAIQSFVNGDRVSQITHNGRTVQFASTSLAELQQIRGEIAKSVRTRGSRYQAVAIDRGL